MTKAGEVLKNIFKSLFHVTCLSHPLHNHVSKITDKYGHVDELNAGIKALTVKNKKHKMKFFETGITPKVIVTRLGSWLNGCR